MSRKFSRLLEPSMSLYFAVLIVFAALALYLHLYGLALAEILTTAVLFGLYQLTSSRRKRRILSLIRQNSSSLETVSQDNDNMPIPMAIVKLSTHEIIWGNDIFYRATGLSGRLFEIRLTDVFPDFSLEWLSTGADQAPDEVRMDSGRYRVFGNLIDHGENGVALLASLYFVELTDMYDMRDAYEQSRPVVSIILVDNYDDLTSGLPDSKVSALSAAIGQKISDWLSRENVSLHELSRNRYLCFAEARNLARLQERRFAILDSIREVKNPAGLAATVSIGIGRDGDGFEENFSFAVQALEMCMYRGGDQVVIKGQGDENYTYFGGRTKEGGHRTSIRARVIAGSLKNLLEDSVSVFIMGHAYADYDAVGAAAGVYALCRSLLNARLPVYIVYSPQNAAENLVELLRQEPEYKNVFVTEQEAMLQIDRRSLLIVVDTNRPDQVQSRQLLDTMLPTGRVVVIDHHRRAADFIAPSALAFHEPSASSASELVTEMLLHSADDGSVLPAEAVALLTGIVLDTKQFSSRTGARTFETAAYLRSIGGDPVTVKTLFQSNLADTLAKHKIVGSAFLYRKQVAISVVENEVEQTIAAQAADALLNVQGVASSFVLYPTGGKVKISARSLSGSNNVQMILEPMGGGGNQEIAAALVAAESTQAALKQLCGCIDDYLDQSDQPDEPAPAEPTEP